MSHDPTRLTRAELYALVWSTPMRVLAPRYGMSDRGLAKLCQRFSIPVPERGWWRRKETGAHVRRTPLHHPDRHDEEVVICAGHATDGKPAAEEPELTIAVPDTLDSPHPLIVQTKKAIGRRRTGPDRVPLIGTKCLDMRVTFASVDRALRIWHALISALESRGHAVSVSVKDAQTRPVTSVALNETTLSLTIEERFDRLPHVPTPREKSALTRARLFGKWHAPLPEFDSVASGEFTVAIEHDNQWASWWARQSRRRWSDSTSRRVDDCLGKVVAAVERCAALKHAYEVEEERKRREREEEWRREREEAERRAREKARREELLEEATAWARADRIRAYVAAVREAAGNDVSRPELSAWIEWATAVADRIDPVPDRIAHKPNTPVSPEEDPDYGGADSRAAS